MTKRPQFVGYDVASQITGFAKPTLYTKVSRRQIPHYRLSRKCVRFRVDELERWLGAKCVPVSVSSEGGAR